MSVSGDERLLELIELEDASGFNLLSIDEQEPSLEDAFIHYTGKTISEEGSQKEQWKAMMRRMGGRR